MNQTDERVLRVPFRGHDDAAAVVQYQELAGVQGLGRDTGTGLLRGRGDDVRQNRPV
jgi:hypothetical protein